MTHIRCTNTPGRDRRTKVSRNSNTLRPVLCGAQPSASDLGLDEARHVLRIASRLKCQRTVWEAWAADICPTCAAKAEVRP
jgi:hypothetical protein